MTVTGRMGCRPVRTGDRGRRARTAQALRARAAGSPPAAWAPAAWSREVWVTRSASDPGGGAG